MHITWAMVRDELPTTIATRGEDFQYSPPEGSMGTCQYIWDGKPDCLFGCYLVDLGVPVEAFAALEGKGIDEIFMDDRLKEYGFTAEPEALMAMGQVQTLQDEQYTWGDSYYRVFEPDTDPID